VSAALYLFDSSSVLSILAFARRRAQFSEFLSSNTSLTVSRYFRLMALAMTDICCTTPLSISVIVLNATSGPLHPWRGWSDTHFDFSRVGQIPAAFWHADHMVVVSLELSRWLVPACAIVFFMFFGLAHEARGHYHRTYLTIARVFGLSREQKVDPSVGILPYVQLT
jgi:pheromone a factor receptor